MKSEDKERSDRVIKVFEDSGLNQRQFAKLIGVSQQLVSAVINYTKKPNETILLGIIDNIKDIDPMWLFTGVEKKETNTPPLNENRFPIDFHIRSMVRNQFEEVSFGIFEKLATIEELIKNKN